MEPILIVLLIGLAIALGIIWIIEIFEYRKYIKAAHSVIALGQSMQVGFDEVATHVNAFGLRQNTIAATTMAHDIDLNIVKAVLQLHSEALGLVSAEKLLEIRKKYEGEFSGEDSVGEVSR